MSVLGGLMMNNRAWAEVGFLREGDFYTQDHRSIWRAMAEMFTAGKPCDFLTMSEYLRRKGEKFLEEAGGLAYLGSLAADTPSAANVKAYAEIVRERAVLRSLIAAGQDIAEMGYIPDGRDSDALLSAAEQTVFALRSGRTRKKEPRNYAALIPLAEQRLESAKGGEALHGAYTGYTEVDDKLNGLHDGDLIVLGGRPGQGKSTLALNVAEYRAQQGDGVLIFSMEMPEEQLVQRSIASMGRIDQEAIRRGTMDYEQWDRYGSISGRLREMPIYIDDTRGQSIGDVCASARLMVARHKIRLIVIDYIQLMTTPGKENRTTEIGHISRGLKILAGDLRLPVIALSQLSRGLEARADKRPMLSDLRESGSIEQDADVVLFVHRDGDDSQIIISKQRMGPTGTAHVAYLPHYSRFDNLAPGSRPAKKEEKSKGKRSLSAEEPLVAPDHWSDR